MMGDVTSLIAPFSGKNAKRGVDLAKELVSPTVSKIKATVPPPTRQDPDIQAAREKQRKAELRRRGRKSSILTSGRGVEEPLGVSRPQARSAELLGG